MGIKAGVLLNSTCAGISDFHGHLGINSLYNIMRHTVPKINRYFIGTENAALGAVPLGHALVGKEWQWSIPISPKFPPRRCCNQLEWPGVASLSETFTEANMAWGGRGVFIPPFKEWPGGVERRRHPEPQCSQAVSSHPKQRLRRLRLEITSSLHLYFEPSKVCC